MEIETVTVSILDRKYRLRVPDSQIEKLKAAAEMVDKTARDYGKKYAYQDYQDLLAMVSLTQMERLLNLDNLLDNFNPSQEGN